MPDSYDPYRGEEKVETDHRIVVVHWWPGEGYGCGERCETMEQARNLAAKNSHDAAGTNGKAIIRIIETTTVTTTVPYPPGSKPELEQPKKRRRSKT
jgi:hypothetical protein